MNNRERVLQLLSGKAPDKVPWFGDLDYWHSAQRHLGTLPKEYEDDGYFQLNRDNGLGFYLQGHMPVKTFHEGIRIESVREGDRIVNTMYTPKGNLTEVMQFLPASSSYGYVKHYVGGVEDLPAFVVFLESLQYEAAYEEAIRRKEIIGDNGGVMCYTPRSPFMQMVTTYSGVESLVYLLLDAPEETRALLTLMEEKHDIAAQLVVESPADFIMIPENLSSEVVGSSYYLEFLRPYEKKWIEQIRKAHKTSFIHMDGTLKGLLALVAETGFDVIEAVTPAPVGDISMAEAARLAPSPTILWGGIPGAMLTPLTPDDEFERHVVETLRLMRSEPRFVLGIGDQLPPDGLLSRIRRTAELCDQYGVYETDEKDG